MGDFLQAAITFVLIGAAYWLGFYDGRRGRPPEAMKGTYDSGDEDRVDDYPDDWV